MIRNPGCRPWPASSLWECADKVARRVLCLPYHSSVALNSDLATCLASFTELHVSQLYRHDNSSFMARILAITQSHVIDQIFNLSSVELIFKKKIKNNMGVILYKLPNL
jgi:hypothetical protein